MRYWSQTFILASKLKNFLLCFLYIKILKLKINKWTTFTFMQIKLSCTEELFNIEIKILHIFREWWVILGNKVKMYVFLYLLLFYYRLNGNLKTILNFNGKHTVTIWNNLKVTNEKLHYKGWVRKFELALTNSSLYLQKEQEFKIVEEVRPTFFVLSKPAQISWLTL